MALAFSIAESSFARSSLLSFSVRDAVSIGIFLSLFDSRIVVALSQRQPLVGQADPLAFFLHQQSRLHAT
jgi:hypothetical protein